MLVVNVNLSRYTIYLVITILAVISIDNMEANDKVTELEKKLFLEVARNNVSAVREILSQ